MLRPGILGNLAIYGASLTAPPVVARATIYIPSHLAASVLGDCQPDAVVSAPDAPVALPIPDSPHAA